MIRRSRLFKCFIAALWLFASTASLADSGRLLGTGGAVSIEATAGGGITPWAVLAGYGTRDASGLETADYGLRTIGGACTLNNRIELSAGRQTLDLGGLRPLLGLPGDQQLRQRFAGIKVRLLGDIVYNRWGQLSAGYIYKDSEDAGLARIAGAVDSSGGDMYLSAGKLFVNGPLGHMAYVNSTVRWTKANQGGLLGFGGDRRNSYSANAELAVALFARRDLALGFEYRQKPDNLGFAAEDDWQDVFLAWFPSKHVSVVAAWAFLGDIGTLRDQDGPYVSIAGSF